MKKIKKKFGILFWITGLPGSGKTSIAKNILPDIKKRYGPTIIINGDDIRNIFKIKKFEKKERLKLGLNYSRFCKFITNQKINIIFSAVALFNEIHICNKKKIKNYVEIFIKANMKTLLKEKSKTFYRKKTLNIWGIDIKPQFPIKPDIIINNNRSKSFQQLGRLLIKKIENNIVI